MTETLADCDQAMVEIVVVLSLMQWSRMDYETLKARSPTLLWLRLGNSRVGLPMLRQMLVIAMIVIMMLMFVLLRMMMVMMIMMMMMMMMMLMATFAVKRRPSTKLLLRNLTLVTTLDF